MWVRSCGMSGSETCALVSVHLWNVRHLCASSWEAPRMCTVVTNQGVRLLVAMRRIGHVRAVVEYVCGCARVRGYEVVELI